MELPDSYKRFIRNLVLQVCHHVTKVRNGNDGDLGLKTGEPNPQQSSHKCSQRH